MDISAIGFTPQLAAIYRYFLRHPGQRADSARWALDMDLAAVKMAVETLGEMSLLDLSDPRRVMATDPKIGLERLIETRLEELNLEIRRVLAARDAIGSFADDQRSGEDSSAVPDIERVLSLDQVRRRLDDLGFFAHSEMLWLHPGERLSADASEMIATLDGRALRRGLTVKAVYHEEVLDDPFIGAYLHDFAKRGGNVRVTQGVMDGMVIFDQAVAVISINLEKNAEEALLIRETGLVAQLISYFDRVWQTACDVGDITGIDSKEPGISSLEKRVLAALATSDKDDIAARDIKISVRTYRRYVADLMARLGAGTRFQLAMRAKEKGWILLRAAGRPRVHRRWVVRLAA